MVWKCFCPQTQQDEIDEFPPLPLHDFFQVGFAHHKSKSENFLDNYCVKLPFTCEDGYFALFEGHGTRDAAYEASKYLDLYLKPEIQSVGPAGDFKSCFETAYLKMDNQLQQTARNYGTSAATCVIRKYGISSRRQVQFANVGNVRAILSRKSHAVRISEEHRATEPKEVKRLEECKAVVRDGLVNGKSIISRALGDHVLKQWIIGSPYYVEFDLMADDNGIIFLGERVWTFFRTDQEVVDMLRGRLDPRAAVFAVAGRVLSRNDRPSHGSRGGGQHPGRRGPPRL